MSRVRAGVDTHLVLRLDDLPDDAIRELKARFTRGNPKFYKSQSMGFFTGNIPKVITAWEEDDDWLYLPRGAIVDVEAELADKGLVLDAKDRTTDLPPAGIEFKGKLRPYQVPAVDALADCGFGGTLRGPPGSGKTVILLATIARLNRPTIVIVHNRMLMDQWREMVGKFLGGGKIGNIGGGKALDIRPVTVAMQQSLWRLADKVPIWVNGFGVVVLDECSHVAARSYQVTASMFSARRRLGASADERRKDGMEWLTTDTLGPVVHEIHKKVLIGLNQLVPVHMDVIPTEYADELYLDHVRENMEHREQIRTVNAEEFETTEKMLEYLADLEAQITTPDWMSMIGDLVNDENRNKLILGVVLKVLEDPGSRVLMLSERVNACRMWVDVLRDRGVSAGLMIGGPTNRAELDRTKAALQSGRVRVGVGTTVADEGLDIPALTHVALTCPVHGHYRRVEQMVGRAARPWEGKQEATAIYFWDRWMFPGLERDDEKRGVAEKRVIGKLKRAVNTIRVVS